MTPSKYQSRIYDKIIVKHEHKLPPDVLAELRSVLARVRHTNIHTPLKDMQETWDILAGAIAKAEIEY